MKETTYTNLVTLLSATLLIPLLVGGNAMVARACKEDLEEKQYANYEHNDTNRDTAIFYNETVITDDFFKNNKGNEDTDNNEFTQNTPKKEGGAIDFQRNICNSYGPDPNFHTNLQTV